MATETKKGKTIWESWMEQLGQSKKKPGIDLTKNPLGAAIGDFFDVGTVDLLGNSLRLCEVDVWRRNIENQDFFFTDYCLHDQVKDAWYTVRVSRKEGFAPDDKHGLEVMLIVKEDEIAYDSGLIEQVLPGGVLEITDNKTGQVIATYFRLVEGMKDSYEAEVTVMEEGKEATVEQVDYFDLFRVTKEADPAVPASEPEYEFYFVEVNSGSDGNGWTTFRRGTILSHLDVTIYPAAV